jgi:hypothetical protein
MATLVDSSTRQSVYEAKGISTERMLTEGVELLNAIADAPELKFAIHFCRGNNAGHWMSAGGYEAISKQVFARLTRYATFLLEYDDARSGSFEPLADIPRDKTVVLGLVSSKTDELESVELLMRRVEEASRYFPRDQMALSTQCGFASVADSAGHPAGQTQAGGRSCASFVSARLKTALCKFRKGQAALGPRRCTSIFAHAIIKITLRKAQSAIERAVSGQRHVAAQICPTRGFGAKV